MSARFKNGWFNSVVNTGPLNLFTNTLSEKTLSDKNFVQRKLLFDEYYIEREKENADVDKNLVRQNFSEGSFIVFYCIPGLAF